MSITREYNDPVRRLLATAEQREASSHLLAVAGPHEEALVSSYRDIFPGKLAELVKLQLAFLVDVPLDYLNEEVYVEGSLSLSRSDEDEERKERKTRLLDRFGKLLHHLRRGGSCDRDQYEGPVEIPAIREEVLANFLAVIDFLLHRDGYAVKGLFRTSVCTTRQRELESLLLSTAPLSPSLIATRFSALEAAAALRSALNRLPQPLLTSRFSPLFAAVAKLTEERCDDRGKPVPFAPGDLTLIGAKQVKALRLLFLLLPDTNRQLIYYLLCFLSRISKRSECHLSSSVLASLFAPSLFIGVRPSCSGLIRQKSLLSRAFTLILDNAVELARVPQTVAGDVAQNLARISHDPVTTCVRYATSGTSRDGQKETTRVAVAELYAEVARWPESDDKRRAVRKLNNLNGGLTSIKSPSVDYLHRNRSGRNSVKRRQLPRADVSELSIPGALQLSTPVRRVADLPTLISFSDPLSPEERHPKWIASSLRCSPGPCSLASQSERPPLMMQ